MLCNLGVLIFDPKRTRVAPKEPITFPIRFHILCVIINYIITLEAHWKAVVGAEIAKKRPKKAKKAKYCNRIRRPKLFNTVKYALNTIQRIIRIRRMTHPWPQIYIYIYIYIWFWPTLLMLAIHARAGTMIRHGSCQTKSSWRLSDEIVVTAGRLNCRDSWHLSHHHCKV